MSKRNTSPNPAKNQQGNAQFRRIGKARHYTKLPNSFLQNTELSFAARGMLSLMLSLPEDWSFNFKWLMQQAPDTGLHKFRTILRELTRHGYVKYHRAHIAGGRFRWEYLFDEAPIPPSTDFPSMVHPSMENQPIYKEPVIQKRSPIREVLVDNH